MSAKQVEITQTGSLNMNNLPDSFHIQISFLDGNAHTVVRKQKVHKVDGKFNVTIKDCEQTFPVDNLVIGGSVKIGSASVKLDKLILKHNLNNLFLH